MLKNSQKITKCLESVWFVKEPFGISRNMKNAIPFLHCRKIHKMLQKSICEITLCKCLIFWNLVTIFRFTMINALKQEQNAWHCCFLICGKNLFENYEKAFPFTRRRGAEDSQNITTFQHSGMLSRYSDSP